MFLLRVTDQAVTAWTNDGPLFLVLLCKDPGNKKPMCTKKGEGSREGRDAGRRESLAQSGNTLYTFQKYTTTWGNGNCVIVMTELDSGQLCISFHKM